MHELCDAGRSAVHVRAAELFEIHLFVRDGLHDAGAGHEHVRDAAHHEDEVRDRRTVYRATGAGAEDRADLRHDAGREGVAEEDVGVPAE